MSYLTIALILALIFGSLGVVMRRRRGRRWLWRSCFGWIFGLSALVTAYWYQLPVRETPLSAHLTAIAIPSVLATGLIDWTGNRQYPAIIQGLASVIICWLTAPGVFLLALTMLG